MSVTYLLALHNIPLRTAKTDNWLSNKPLSIMLGISVLYMYIGDIQEIDC